MTFFETMRNAKISQDWIDLTRVEAKRDTLNEYEQLILRHAQAYKLENDSRYRTCIDCLLNAIVNLPSEDKVLQALRNPADYDRMFKIAPTIRDRNYIALPSRNPSIVGSKYQIPADELLAMGFLGIYPVKSSGITGAKVAKALKKHSAVVLDVTVVLSLDTLTVLQMDEVTTVRTRLAGGQIPATTLFIDTGAFDQWLSDHGFPASFVGPGDQVPLVSASKETTIPDAVSAPMYPPPIGSTIKVKNVNQIFTIAHQLALDEKNVGQPQSPIVSMLGVVTNIDANADSMYIDTQRGLVETNMVSDDGNLAYDLVGMPSATSEPIPVSPSVSSTLPSGPGFLPVLRTYQPPLNKNLVYIERIKPLFDLLVKYYHFDDIEKAKVFFAALMVEDVKILLKGVPGVGKTTLLEACLTLISNPYDLDKAVLNITPQSGTVGKDAFKTFNDAVSSALPEGDGGFVWDAYDTGNKGGVHSVPIKGIARINPDKMPEEILYYTDIYQWQREQSAQTTNPSEIKFEDVGAIVGAQKFEFKPRPRPVVTAPIKFFNEINRANKPTQDAILPLMAEGEVEQYGVRLTSPKSISFFDYNPHLDRPETRGGGELDPAFLDRIDLSVFISGADYQQSKDIIVQQLMPMGHTSEDTEENKIGVAKSVGLSLLEELHARKILPLCLGELYDIWKDVKSIDIDDTTLDLAVIYVSLLKTSYRTYASEYYRDSAVIPGTTQPDFIDTTRLTYGKQAINKQTPQVPSGHENFVEFIEDIIRPMGARALQSLCKIAKAYAYLDQALKLPVDSLAALKKEDVKVTDEHLKRLLPYVSDHRINLGVNQVINLNWLSFYDFVAYYLVPEIINTSQPTWLTWLRAKNTTVKYVRDRQAGKLLPLEGPIKVDDLEKEAMAKFDATVNASNPDNTAELAQRDPILNAIRKMVISRVAQR